MGLMDTFFGPKKSSFKASEAIAADQAAKDKAFAQNKTAAGQVGPYGKSVYGDDGSVHTEFTGPMAGINTGLLGGLAATSDPNATATDFTQLNPQAYLDARMDAYNTYADPAREAAEERWIQDRQNRGLPVGDAIDASKYKQIADADTSGRRAAFGEAYTALPGALATMTDTELKQKFAPAQANLGLLQGIKSFLPQAGNVSTSAVNSGDYMRTEAQANDQAAAQRAANIGAAAKMGIALAAAPFTGGASLSAVGGGGGGGGLFNSIGSYFGGGGPSGPNGAYTPSQFQNMWANATPSLPWAQS